MLLLMSHGEEIYSVYLCEKKNMYGTFNLLMISQEFNYFAHGKCYLISMLHINTFCLDH